MQMILIRMSSQNGELQGDTHNYRMAIAPVPSPQCHPDLVDEPLQQKLVHVRHTIAKISILSQCLHLRIRPVCTLKNLLVQLSFFFSNSLRSSSASEPHRTNCNCQDYIYGRALS